MSERFYSRQKPVRHVDGSTIFQDEESRQAEKQVAKQLATAWGVKVQHFAPLSPVDFYLTQYDRVVGVAELKCRDHDFGKYPTVYLAVRKWLALALAGNGLGVPAIFVVRFTDGLYWIPIREVDASNVTIGGLRFPQKAGDIEPLIEVPVESLHKLNSTLPKREKDNVSQASQA